MNAKSTATIKKVSILSLISLILMFFNILNVVLNRQHISNLIWYDDANIYLMTLIKCICYCIVPLLMFLSLKLKKRSLLVLSSIMFILSSAFMLFFNDVSNYIFNFILGGLGIISAIFMTVSAISLYNQKNNTSTHIIACFFNAIIIIFSYIFLTVVIPEGLSSTNYFPYDFKYILHFGIGYNLFSLFYYVIQSVFFVLLLNSFNLLFFNNCERAEFETEYAENGYTHIAKHILMPICTLGLYTLGWIYNITKFTRSENSNNSKEKAIEAVVLNLFIPFYSIYWYYKIAKNIEALFASKGNKNQSFSTLIIVLSIFLPYIAYIVLQSKFNEAITCRCKETESEVGAWQQKPDAKSTSTNVNYVEEIKALKDLLDIGAITQEEFEAKKKQLLEL